MRVRGGHGGYEGNHLKVIMDIFRTLGSRSLSVTAMLNFSGKANTSIKSLREDNTAMVPYDYDCTRPTSL